eukprot:g81017.t1
MGRSVIRAPAPCSPPIASTSLGMHSLSIGFPSGRFDSTHLATLASLAQVNWFEVNGYAISIGLVIRPLLALFTLLTSTTLALMLQYTACVVSVGSVDYSPCTVAAGPLFELAGGCFPASSLSLVLFILLFCRQPGDSMQGRSQETLIKGIDPRIQHAGTYGRKDIDGTIHCFQFYLAEEGKDGVGPGSTQVLSESRPMNFIALIISCMPGTCW